MSSWYLDNFPQISKAMLQVIPWEVAFASTDLEKFTYLEDSRFELPGVQVGKRFAQGLGSDTAIKTRQASSFELDDSHYGVAMKVITAPVFDDEQPDAIVGTYLMAISRQNAFNLQKMAQNYQESMIEIASAVEDNAIAASSINSSEEVLHENIIYIRQNADDIVRILEDINNIAGQTKMLGLNAAIEAARAGDAGDGFGVVAEEIRKLSDSSRGTAAMIKTLIDKVNTSITRAIESSQISLKASEEQAVVSQEINAQIEEMTSLIHELNRVAQEI